nr:hypothetical protein [Marinobacter similis]
MAEYRRREIQVRAVRQPGSGCGQHPAPGRCPGHPAAAALSPGSQIANIRDIQTGLRECARFYSELRQLGAPIDTVDIGGGLGVDYEAPVPAAAAQ